MLNSYWLFAPFIIQMIWMTADEFWFHRRRGLPRWERIGHPLDTLTVVLCLVWILCVQPNRQTVLAFIVLAGFSCLFVAKDEPVHQRYCGPAEHWIHAILFLLHPVALAAAGLLWPAAGRSSPPALFSLVRYSGYERPFLLYSCALMIGFGIYQFVFWNLLWDSNGTARKTR